MCVDWSKYPSLPDPPKLPEWRDTPEHEAYWNEVCAIEHPMRTKFAFIIFLILWCSLSLCLFFSASIDHLGIVHDLLAVGMSFLITVGPLLIVWGFVYGIWYQVLQIKISLRYGFYIHKLKRPDISKEIGEILADRPDFDKAEFCKYWQSREQKETALRILTLSEGQWILHKKMLYPNDPLLLFYYGRTFFFGKERIIVDTGEFFEDIADEFCFYEWNEINEGTSFAELVERCISANKSNKEENYASQN